MVRKETIRLYRGEGPELDMTKMPNWMKSTQGMWHSSDINVAKRFAEMREGSKIYYIEVPKSVAYSWLNEGGIEKEEYLVPREALKNFKKIYIENQDKKEDVTGLEARIGVFILFTLAGIAIILNSSNATGYAVSNLTQATPGLSGLLFFVAGLVGLFLSFRK